MTEKTNPQILVVDDNTQNLQFLGNLLSKSNYELAIAQNGELALEFLEKEIPDLILLDVMMPGIDGYEVCRRLKKNHKTRDIPVIFLTAKSEVEDLVKGFEVGAVDYVTKPFNSLELLARVKTHVELKRAREEISSLQGIVPICAQCKKIRDDEGYWKQLESYIESHTDAQFSHGICPECSDKLYGEMEWYKKLKKKKENQ
ncbi:response regulator [bacterium]|nr:response regulator [bacterium]